MHIVCLKDSHCRAGRTQIRFKVQRSCQNTLTSVRLAHCNAGDGSGPRYTFVYPNTMVNRYSMWMGTIRVCLDLLTKGKVL